MNVNLADSLVLHPGISDFQQICVQDGGQNLCIAAFCYTVLYSTESELAWLVLSKVPDIVANFAPQQASKLAVFES